MRQWVSMELQDEMFESAARMALREPWPRPDGPLEEEHFDGGAIGTAVMRDADGTYVLRFPLAVGLHDVRSGGFIR